MGGHNCLYVGASYLDPSLKTFSFAKDTREWKNLLQHAIKAARENALSCIFVTDESEDSDIEDIKDSPDSDVASKKTKYDPFADPFAEFKNAALDMRKETGHGSKYFEADVKEESRCYNSIAGVSLQ